MTNGIPGARMCPFRHVEPGWPGSRYPRVTCTVHPRPADTFLVSEAERAWFAYHVDPVVPVTGQEDDRGGHVAGLAWQADGTLTEELAGYGLGDRMAERRQQDEEHANMVAGWRRLRQHADDDILAWLRTASA
jgi:hypothetical protein